MRKVLVAFFIFMCAQVLTAHGEVQNARQDYSASQVEMADQFRADGKIYVLTGIILIILFGTVVYLIVIDRKVSRLEQELRNDGH